ncbi:MAG: bifunctional aldehyde dehydrogenase/enoyl-CoA hydratase [Myxococcales bacterium]
MKVVRSHIGGQWVAGEGRATPLHDPTTGEVIAEVSTEGLDLAGGLEFSRAAGGALRAMSFAERGEALARMAKVVHGARDELLDLSTKNNGATRGDGKFDVDGASGTLMSYAALGKELGDRRYLLDGDPVQLSRSPRFVGQHVRVPLHGVALHVNAFNFPAWGYAEKAAVALLAGVPVVTKPAPATALVAERMHELFVEAGVLPAGALSLVSGEPGDLVSHLRLGDLLAFTGSRATAARIRQQLAAADAGVRLTVEADSLNAAVLGPDVDPEGDTWGSFLFDVVRDVTQKAGQKCTAIRRVLVPREHVDRVVEELSERLGEVVVGDPALDKVRMGPVVSAQQLAHVRAGVARLLGVARPVRGSTEPTGLAGVEDGRGYFVTPVLLRADDSRAAALHSDEVFGPVATVIGYDGSVGDAVDLVRMGRGGLVSSVYSDDVDFAAALGLGLAPWLGRVYLGGEKVAEHSPGPGAVFPTLVHGGPGRAGMGEELGGLRGLAHYTQRTAIQGYRPVIEKM